MFKMDAFKKAKMTERLSLTAEAVGEEHGRNAEANNDVASHHPHQDDLIQVRSIDWEKSLRMYVYI